MPTDRTGDRDCPFAPARDGVTVALRLTPKARRDQILGFDRDAAGAVRCRVAVAAPPAEGKANAALLKLLAKEWGVPKSSLSIAVGAGARDKLVHVAGDPADLLERLNHWKERVDGSS